MSNDSERPPPILIPGISQGGRCVTFPEQLWVEHASWERRAKRRLRWQIATIFVAAIILTLGWVELLERLA